MNEKPDKAVKIIVRGVVQGVGYRHFVYRQATAMGLTGWTKNLPDGSVEVLAEGDSSLLEQLVNDLRVGPRSAEVTAVETIPVELTGQFESFEIKGW